jgi:uncharacterized coiled-coil protein SlyX
MKQVASLVLCLTITSASVSTAAAQRKSPPAKRQAAASEQLQEMSAQIQELKAMVHQQQEKIQSLSDRLQQREQAATETQSAATSATNTAAAAQKLATQNEASVSTLNTQVSDLSNKMTTSVSGLQEDQKKLKEAIESPVALHFKGITITPGGFLAAETVYHSRGLLSDVNTPFNSIPFGGSGQSRLNDFYGSGRQSRITLLAEGKLKSATLRGYYESDWLGAGITSNNNLSNSYVNRQRQLFAQAAFNNGVTITGGQMWSLITETRKSTDNRTEALPLTIDPMYTVGFSWARQYGFRVQKNFNNRFTVAFAIENPQILLAASGATGNFLIGGPGNGGGLYNPTANYSLNYMPDFVGKIAIDSGIGHFEVFGLLRNFHDRIYPSAGAVTPSAAGAFNTNLVGGGGGANARVSFRKKVELGLHVLGGNGIGRYGTGNLTDVTVRPDGSLSMLKSFQSYGTLEFHSKMFDWYFYGGGEFVGNSWSLNSAGRPVGYGSPLFDNSGCNVEAVPTAPTGFAPGSPARCIGQTRNLIEGTAGFWFKPYNGPKGRIQFGPQYSYITRNTWAGTGGQPHAIENMVLTSFRYYIP